MNIAPQRHVSISTSSKDDSIIGEQLIHQVLMTFIVEIGLSDVVDSIEHLSH